MSFDNILTGSEVNTVDGLRNSAISKYNNLTELLNNGAHTPRTPLLDGSGVASIEDAIDSICPSATAFAGGDFESCLWQTSQISFTGENVSIDFAAIEDGYSDRFNTTLCYLDASNGDIVNLDFKSFVQSNSDHYLISFIKPSHEIIPYLLANRYTTTSTEFTAEDAAVYRSDAGLYDGRYFRLTMNEVNTNDDIYSNIRYGDITNGDYDDLAIRATLKTIATHINLYPNQIRGFLFDSEFYSAVADPVTSDWENVTAIANDNGITNLSIWADRTIPEYSGLVDPTSEEEISLAWAETKRGFPIVYGNVSQVVYDKWPNLKLTHDYTYDSLPYQHKNLNRFQDWVFSAIAPNDPSRICERLFLALGKRQRGISRSNAKFVAGPQMIMQPTGDISTWRPTPAHIFSEACWLAIAFGAVGVIHWGINYIFDANGNFQTYDNGLSAETLWNLLATLKSEVYDSIGTLVNNWTFKTRRMAMWRSYTNHRHFSGAGSTTYTTPPAAGGPHSPEPLNREFINNRAYNNMVRAVVRTGEPCDEIWDEDILEDDLDNYSVLIVPICFVTTQNLCDKIQTFIDGGGIVMTHPNSALEGAGVTGLTLLDGEYNPGENCPYFVMGYEAYTDITASQYITFIRNIAEDIKTNLPFDPMFNGGSSHVISNIFTYDNNDYLVLVNDNRSVGDEGDYVESLYTSSIGYPMSNLLEECASETVLNTTGYTLIDYISGDVFQNGTSIPLDPGWGRILKIQISSLAESIGEVNWKDVMIRILRILINDDDENLDYLDETLINLLLVAAQQVLIEIDFDNDYTIDIYDNISPDPTVIATKDDVFINLVLLKALCLIDRNKIHSKSAIDNIRVKCGSSALDIVDNVKAIADLLKFGSCGAYEQLKMQTIFGDFSRKHGVMSPFISNNCDLKLSNNPPHQRPI